MAHGHLIPRFDFSLTDTSERYITWYGTLVLSDPAHTYSTGGIVCSFAPQLAYAGYQECGMTGLDWDHDTGLTASTTYYFKVNHNGAGVVEKSITTGTSVNFEDVIPLMNAQMTGSLGGVTWSIVGADLRCTAGMSGFGTSIALAAGTTGTNLFATLTGFSAFDTAVAGANAGGPAQGGVPTRVRIWDAHNDAGYEFVYIPGTNISDGVVVIRGQKPSAVTSGILPLDEFADDVAFNDTGILLEQASLKFEAKWRKSK